LALWLCIQLLALLATLLRLPLAAGYPQPAELWSAHAMAMAQVVAAALLFPWLFSGTAPAVATIASAWPFAVLAGVLSGIPATRIVSTTCFVTAWMASLWAWNASTPATTRPSAVAVALLLCLGSLILFYLSLEFADHAGDDVTEAARWAQVSPPWAALRQLEATPRARDYGIPVVVAVGAFACRIFARRSGQVIHSS
jgi:hypothetical protein